MRSIKTKLVVSFSILVFGVAFIIGLIAGVTAYNSLKKEAQYSLQLLSEQGAKLVENRMDKQVTELEMVALNKEVINMGWEVNLDVLKGEMEKTEYMDIGYVMPNGYTHFTDGTVRLMSDRSYVVNALAGKTTISDVIISRVTREPEIEVAVPISNGSEVVAALIGRLDANALSEITKDIGHGDQGYSFMINGNGTMIAHPDMEKVLGRYNPIEGAEKDPTLSTVADAFQRILDNKNGVESFSMEGDNLYAGYSPIEGTIWSFVITAAEDEIMASVTSMVRMLIIIILIVFVCSLGLVLLLDSRLTKPLIELTKQSKKLGALDIRENISITYLEQKDEIGTLSGAFQNLTENLRNIIKELNESANHVSDTANELTAHAQQSSSTSETINIAISEIAGGALEQADNTEAGLSQVLLLEKKIDNNNQCMDRLNKTTNQVTNAVKVGLNEVDRLLLITEDNRSAVDNICDIIKQVGESSQQIGDATKAISDISAQTNLLALNASIEAARAGEAGKGFTVVADEVRKLADQSASSTKHIDNIINNLQDVIDKAVKSMNRISVASKDQQECVLDTIGKYHSIADNMKRSEEALRELNRSEQEMVEVNKEIKAMLQSLSAIAEQNASSTHEVAATMEEQTASVQVLAEVSERMTELSASLRKTVEAFKL